MKIAIIGKDHSMVSQEVTVLPQEKTQFTLPITQDTVAVLLNHEDLTFAKVEIDDRSRQYFGKCLKEVPSSVSRAIIWKSYLDMVKSSSITSK